MATERHRPASADTAIAPASSSPVVARLEEEARRRPRAVAAAFGDEQLTNAGLNTRANRVARLLVARGIAAGDRVGVCVERSLDVVVARLGIMKAGAAGVPVDLPSEGARLADPFDDSGLAVVLTRGAPTHSAFQSWRGVVLDLADRSLAAEEREGLATEEPARIEPRRTVGSFFSLSAFAVLLAPAAGPSIDRPIALQVRRLEQSLHAGDVDPVLDMLCAAAGVDLTARTRISFSQVGPPANRSGFLRIGHDPAERSGPAGSHTVDVFVAAVDGRLQVQAIFSPDALKPAQVHALIEGVIRSRPGVSSDRRSAPAETTPAALAHPMTPEGLRALLERSRIERALVEDVLPLTPMQEAIVFHQRLDPGSEAYVQQITLRLRGPLHQPAFSAAWQALGRRHEALRVRIVSGETRPLQVVLRVPDFGYRWLEGADREAVQAADRQLDLEHGPLWRVSVVHNSTGVHDVVWTFSHVLFDGWCVGILFEEFAELYGALTEGREPSLPLPARLGPYIAWLEGRDAGAARAAYASRLAGFTEPTGVPKDGVPGSAADVRQLRFALDADTTTGLQELAAGAGVTLGAVLQAVWVLLLARYNQANDVVYGLTVSGRPPELRDAIRTVGCFINTLPIRVPVTLDRDFAHLARAVQASFLALQDHQHLPLAEVQSLTPLRSSLLDHVFVLENYPAHASVGVLLRGVTVDSTDLREQLPYAFGLICASFEGQIHFRLHFDSAVYSVDRVAAVARHLQNICAGVVAAPAATLRDIDVMDDVERTRVVVGWNRTAAPLRTRTIVDVFEQQCARTPDQVALLEGDTVRSYSAVNHEANHIARALREGFGVRLDEPVGVCLPRSIALVTSILAILKSGGGYLPLDPALPPARLRSLLSDSGVTCVLADSANVERVSREFTGTVVDVERQVHDATDTGNLDRRVCEPASLAYVIYTSGSSGQPKGVLIQHESVVNRLQWMQRAYPLDPSDVLLQKTPFGFDVSVWELFWWAFAGASLVTLPNGAERDPAAIVTAVHRHRVTTLHFVPSMLDAFLSYVQEHGAQPRLTSLRRVFVSGEALLARQIEAFRAVLGVPLLNLYGPTEATVDVSAFDTAGWHGGSVPIGRPIDNTSLFVLDRDLSPQPIGVPGEIAIGGLGLARGYLGNPALTADAFRPDPFGVGSRVYLTGDRGRFGLDGQLHYLGRLDAQVKVRGQRVEPGEIEAQLLAQPGVRQAAVGLLDGDLVAYVVGEVEGLRDRLRETLPDALVPSFFVPLDALPLTANGKLDRRALPAPARTPPRDPEPPRDRTERVVLAAFAEVLGRPLGRDESFFDAGGHSLNALRVASRIGRDLGVEVPIGELFSYSTAAALAAVLRERSPARFAPIERMAHDAHSPASHAQRRMWVLVQMGGQYHVPGAVRVRGDFDQQRLLDAVQHLADRHESLRTRFVMESGELRQVVDPQLRADVRVVDRRGATDVAALVNEEAARPFDLERGPLAHVALLQLAERDVVVVLTLHHIVSDAWTVAVLLRELMALYAGQPLPAAGLRYRDYAAWQRRLLDDGAMATHREHWRAVFADDVPALELPSDYARPTERSFAGDRVWSELDAATVAGLAELSRRSGASLFMTLVAIVKVLLYRYSGQPDVSIGTAVSGRERPELERVVGLFVNTVVLRDRLDGAEPFERLLARVRQTAVLALEHQSYPFDVLVEEVLPRASTARNPLFDVMVTLADLGPELSMGGAEVTSLPVAYTEARLDLTFSFAPTASGLGLSLDYSTELFARRRVERMATHFRELVTAVLADASQAVGRLPLLPAAEVEWLQRHSGAASTAVSLDTVLDLFERQVERTPEAAAARCGADALTYRALDERANALAHHLRSVGVRREDRVALCLPPSLEALVAALGVLKAGGAYVPLDPDMPPARIESLLADTAPALVIVRQPLATAHPVCLLGAWPARSGPLPDRPGPQDAAYVLYTSGSTGQPKGVVVEHASLANYLQWALGAVGPGTFPLFTSLSVDLTVTSLFLPLISGHTVHVARGDAGEALRDAFSSEDDVDCVKLTPSHIALLNSLQLRETQVRLVIVGGEALGRTHIDTLRRLNPAMRIVNEYGPTEATVGCVAIDATASAPSRIGRPIAGAQVWVVDRDGELAPEGVWGELYVGGPCLARGYLGRPDLTAERFVWPVFANGERCYRTGDRVRFTAEGDLEYGGRLDDQVKLRGHRIELEEIEFHLAAQPGVERAAVALHDGELVAFVVGESAGLQRRVRELLPAAMVPARIVSLAALPLLPSGKLDRRALPRSPAIEREPPADGANSAERTILAVFTQVLGKRLAPDDDFFDAGGHSLSAILAAIQLTRELGAAVSLRDVFAHPTAAALAAVVRDLAPARLAPIARVSDAADYPVSHAQRRMWVLVQMGGHYGMPGAVRLRGPLETDTLRRALDAVMRRHESLRTRFGMSGAELRQRVELDTVVDLRIVDVQDQPDPERRARELVQEQLAERFDLSRGPLLRVRLFQLGADDRVLMLALHHIVADGLSVAIVLREVVALYGGAALPALRFQYRDYAAWETEQIGAGGMQPHREHWLTVLAGPLPVLEFPTDRPRQNRRNFAGERVWLELDASLRTGLQDVGRRAGATLFMTLVAVVKVLLYRYTGQTDLIVGSPVSGRDHAGLDDQVGLYVNTVVLRDRIRPDRGFDVLLRQVRETAVLAYQHQAYPFDLLVDQVVARRDTGRNPLFDVMVLLAPPETDSAVTLPGVVMTAFPFETSESRFDLTFAFADLGDRVGLSIEYSTELFERATAARIGEHLRILVDSLVRSPSMPVGVLPMATEAERYEQHALSAAGCGDSPSATIVDLFAARVSEVPERPALLDDGQVLTYRDLDARANGIAWQLRSTGNVSGQVVAVVCSRPASMVVACLGVLKAGAVYLPLDSDTPLSRRSAILTDSGARVLLTDGAQDDGLDITEVPAARVAPTAVVHGDDLAYVIYTSGSTGTPKGVAVAHAAFANMALTQIGDLGITAADRMAQFSSPAFDASLYEMFLALLSGAALAIVPATAKSDAAGFLEWLRRDRPSVLVLPPSFLRALDRAPLPHVRVLVTAGEDAIAEDARHYARALRVINAYGPTEFAVCATWHEVDADGSGRIPIGRPIANTTACVLDGLQQMAPAGVPGELYLGGAGVARGYLARADLTAERFVPDPFNPGARLFRTGDRASVAADGNVLFLGRLDHQIKLRGYRIEPGDIQHHILQLPGISAAAVVERGGELLAYVVGVVSGVREHLQERLPAYMVPGRFIAVGQLPLTSSGKLDYHALPDPESATSTGRAARNDTERRVLEIFGEVLGAAPGVEDDFFSSGGHSLRAIQVASRIGRAFGVALPLRAVFLHPTAASLSEILRTLKTGRSTPIPVLPPAADYPASHAQRRLWVLSRLGGGYVLPAAGLIEGPLDRERLQRAVQDVVARHDSLRTRFGLVDGSLRQRIDAAPAAALRVVTLASEADADGWLRAEAARPFDLAAGPLCRFALLELPGDRHVLALMLHHAVADAWSLDVLVGELTALYAGGTLPPLPIQYRDYAAWQAQQLATGALDPQRDYWHAQLGGELPVLDLPTDYARPAVHSFAGGTVGSDFSGLELAALEALGRRADASLFMVLLTAVKVLLHRYTGQSDIIVGSPIAGRSQPELEDQVGLFVNTVALRDPVRGAESFLDLLGRVRENALAAFDHGGYPFDLLVDELSVSRDLARSPIFDVMLVLQEAPRHRMSLGAATVRPFALDWAESKFDLTFSFARRGDALAAEIAYSRDLFTHERIVRLSAHLRELVEALLRDPSQPVATLRIAPCVERPPFEPIPFPQDHTVVTLFEAQARRTPDGLAVVNGSRSLTYGELNTRANGVARLLREVHGVGIEDRVGISMEPSPWLIVAALGVLKAGAAYVPIPLDAGPVRTARMIDDGACRLVLGGPGAADDSIDVSRVAPDTRNPAPRVAPRNLAYVIYTSGSSGHPKGVLVEHHALVNLATWHASAFGLAADSRATLYASIGFDASVWETWPYLLCGGCLFPLADSLRLDLPRLSRFVRDQGITHLFVPTALVESLLALDPLHGVTILTGGEALHFAGRPPRVVINNYGPTEAAVVATSTPVTAVGVAPIGAPIANVEVVVLDSTGAPVPPGVDGEIAVAGICLARGYANDPGLTAERFTPHPWRSGDRIYRTGDRGRVDFDGVLWFRGRLDDQVKLRGQRVEPGEVEFHLLAQPGVTHAVVVPRNGALVAFVVGEVDGLKERLRALLPEVLVPSRIVATEMLPLTASGKVDRRRLVAPPVDESPADHPHDDVERVVVAAIAAVLGRRVGRHENFFDAGGHSVTAVQLASRLARDLEVDLPLRDVFTHPSAASLSAAVRGMAPARFEEIPRLASAPDYPVSHAQRRMWVLAQMGGQYHVPGALRLRGELDRDRLMAAIRAVVSRHESLRTRFVMVGEELRQRIDPEPSIDIRVTTLAAASDAQVRAVFRAEQEQPFDLERDSPVRVTVIELGPHETVMLVVVHHIASDGESMRTLLRELTSSYQGVPLPGLQRQYRDYAVWQRGLIAAGSLQRDRDYWGSVLTGQLTPLELPADRSRPLRRSFAGDRVHVALEPAEVSRLLDLGARRGASLFMTLVALVQVLLYRYTGQQDVVVGSPVSGRTRAELEGVVGLFVNTIVLRSLVQGDESFDSLLSRVRETALLAYQHQAYPFDLLVDDVGAARDLGRNPLFDVMVSMMPAMDAGDSLRLSGIEVTPVPLDSGDSKFDLTFGFGEVSGALHLSLEYSTELFERARVEGMGGHFCTLVRSVLSDSSRAIGQLAIVDSVEARGLACVHGVPVAHPADETVIERFEQQARQTPHAQAVRCGDLGLTYRELDRRAERLASCLRAWGVRPEVRVAVHLEPTADVVVSVLAVLKAGGAYVPLDPGLPAHRLAVLIADTQSAVVITQAALAERLPPDVVRTIRVDVDVDWPGPGPFDGPGERSGRHAAYVIYTSGSSGEPKGVVVEHANLNHYSHWAADYYFAGRRGGDFPLFTSLGFDLTVTSLFLPLLLGRCVHVLQGDAAQALAWVFGSGAVDSVKLTPSHITLLAGLNLSRTGVSLAIVGGEALSWEQVHVLRRLNPAMRVVNEYGPTEATVGCVAGEAAGVGAGDVPIGRPIENTEAWVVERDGQLAPIGVWGELFVGGAGVARGYLGREDLTAERFVRPAFAGSRRCYRTGDRVRWRRDGELEYGGRLDDQLKVRGHRVEPEEIAHHLRALPGVQQARVIMRDRELVAYVVGETERARERLRGVLPVALVPAHIVSIDTLPIGPSGKLDWRRLPAPRLASPESDPSTTPPDASLDESERAVLSIFEQVLGHRVAVDDDFFAAGGHSLTAVQVANRLGRDLRVGLSLRDVFAYPTARALAVAVRRRAPLRFVPVPRVPDSSDYAVSHAQRRMWVLAQMGARYHISAALQLSGELDQRRLLGAIQDVVDRHEGLRARFIMSGGRLRQRVAHDRSVEAVVTPLDREDRLEDLLRHECARPFDLEHGPLVRVRLLQLAPDQVLLLITMHHIASDGWSAGVLLQEAIAHYQGRELPALPLQYRDYAAWQNALIAEGAMEEHRTYWLRALAGSLPTLNLPADYPRPAERSFAGDRVWLELDDRESAGLTAIGRRAGASLFMVVVALVKTLLYRYTGERDVIVGTPVSGRDRAELEGQVGLYANTVTLRDAIRGDEPFDLLLGRVRETALLAYEHQAYPFDLLVGEVAARRDPGRNPIFDVMVVLATGGEPDWRVPGLVVTGVAIDHGESKFDLMFSFAEHAGSLGVGIEYSTELFERSRVERMLEHFRALARAVVSDASTPIGALGMLTRSERAALESVARPLPRTHETLIDRFEAQVTQAPDRVAVTHLGRHLTYRELDERANGLAHRLRALGVGPEARVGLCLERSIELIVGLVGILKAGAAYLPLDPGYPPARLALMLADAGVSVLVTESTLANTHVPGSVAVVRLTTDAPTGMPSGPVVPRDPGHAAYVIYTSGSSGVPKGVVVEHAQVVRLFDATADWTGFDAGDVWTLFHSYGFDFSVWEIWGALLHGSRLVVVPSDTARSPQDFLALLEQEGVTVLNQTPSAFVSLMQAGAAAADLPALRLVIFGGEALEPRRLREWFTLRGDEAPVLVNMYGITETTVHVTRRRLTAADAEEARSDIGEPLTDLRVHVLDRDLAPVPTGVPGEIFVSGAGLARGYLNRPDLTAERFLPDPWSVEPGGRMYRSGDLARRPLAGSAPGSLAARQRGLEYQGRRDAQVKVRGFRIEPGEIEAVLAQDPTVQSCVVMIRRDGMPEPRLVAYVIPRGQAAVARWRDHLRAHLPEHMVPAALVPLAAFPLTPNGKVDRAALPAPEWTSTGNRAPRDAVELTVAQIFEQVLGLDTVGLRDSFFDVGGDSLSAVRVMTRLREQLGIRLPLAALFRGPTVEQIAVAARRAQPGPRCLVPLRPTGSRPPLFLVHPAGGTVFCYGLLASQLSRDQPVYGLQAQGLDGREPPLRAFEAMAARYQREIRQVQPEGPYFLGGWSLGGLVAFEMAKQLSAAGQHVALLALLDTHLPMADEKPQDEAGRWAAMLGPELGLSAEALRTLDREARLDEVVDAARRSDLIPIDFGREEAGQLLSVYEGITAALNCYVLPPYEGELQLFRAEQSTATGWEERVAHVTTTAVPGSHQSMLSLPHVAALAQELERHLARFETPGIPIDTSAARS